MSEEFDPRMEVFIQEAQGREDVYRFKQVLEAVAAKVEASETDTPVIPIGRQRTFGYIAAAASVAVLVIATTWWMNRDPGYAELAMGYVQDDVSAMRGEIVPSDPDEDLLDSARHYLATNEAAKALDLIATRSFASPCTEARRLWLVALAHLMLEQKEQAAIELRSVAGSGCMVQDAAAELLEKL